MERRMIALTESISKSFEFLAPTRIIFGAGSIHTLPEEIKNLDGKRILVCACTSETNTGFVSKTLQESGIQVTFFNEIGPNPTEVVIQKGLEIAKKTGSDLFIGLGGGSAIDTAKAIGLLTTNPGRLEDYEGANLLKNPPPPIIAIPTTAGSGSEVTGSTVIIDEKRDYKASVRSPFLYPKVAVIDPQLLTTLPQDVAAYTGIDALTHAIEAFISTKSSILTDSLAIQAVRLISGNLRVFVANPENMEAASAMALGSLLAGIAFANARVGTVHAMSHPLSGHFDTPHGLANAVLLPTVMEFNLTGNPQKMAFLAEVVGERIEGLSTVESAGKLIDAIKKFLKDLNIPDNLKEIGISKEAINRMAEDAAKSGIAEFNPRKTSISDMIDLYNKAFSNQKTIERS